MQTLIEAAERLGIEFNDADSKAAADRVKALGVDVTLDVSGDGLGREGGGT
jgi:hypothetical protein